MSGPEVEKQSPVDAEISRLDEETKATRKAIECLAERLIPVTASATPPPESETVEDSKCSLGGRIRAIQDVAEGNTRILIDIRERLQV